MDDCRPRRGRKRGGETHRHKILTTTIFLSGLRREQSLQSKLVLHFKHVPTSAPVLKSRTGAVNIPTRNRNDIFRRWITRAWKLKLSDLGSSDCLGEGTKNFWGQRGVLCRQPLGYLVPIGVFVLFELVSKIFDSQIDPTLHRPK